VRRRFDIGKVLASWGNADVVESFGGGLFAEVLVRAEDVDDDETVEAGLRLLEGVLEAVPERDWELDVDGREVSEPLLAVEAMNVRETGPTVPLAPRADPGDGQLEVVRIRPSDREPLLDYIAARLRGESPEAPPLPSVRGSRLTARPPTDCPLRVDDKLWPDEPQAWDAEPVVASMGERAVNVLIPAE
jgi:diacylglycerol kinase family enzyme